MSKLSKPAEPLLFGAVVQCRLDDEVGFAVVTQWRTWIFKAPGAITRSGIAWRDLKDVTVIFGGVDLPWR